MRRSQYHCDNNELVELSVLRVQLGVQPRKVTEHSGETRTNCSVHYSRVVPEGEIYWYYSLGFCCVISDGRVESINLFAQPQPDRPVAIAETPPAPELAGVPIGATVNVLEDSLGKAAQVRQAHDGLEKIYSYVRDPCRSIFLSRVLRFTLLHCTRTPRGHESPARLIKGCDFE